MAPGSRLERPRSITTRMVARSCTPAGLEPRLSCSAMPAGKTQTSAAQVEVFSVHLLRPCRLAMTGSVAVRLNLAVSFERDERCSLVLCTTEEDFWQADSYPLRPSRITWNGSINFSNARAKAIEAETRKRIERAIARARLVLLWESIWPVLAPLLVLAGLFAIVSWFGLWRVFRSRPFRHPRRSPPRRSSRDPHLPPEAARAGGGARPGRGGHRCAPPAGHGLDRPDRGRRYRSRRRGAVARPP